MEPDGSQKKGIEMKKNTTVAMALAMGLTMTGLAVARPMQVTDARRIKAVRTSDQFRGRQTPKFKLTPIVIPPIDYSGGANLAAAKASVAKALADVQKEVLDQKKVIKGNKNRIIAAQKNVAKYKTLRITYSDQYAAIQAEVDVLEAIENPSSAIQTCLNELKGDLAAAKKQLVNVDKTIKEYKSRVKFYKEVSLQANGNLKRLNSAVNYLTNAHKTLRLVKKPAPKAGWMKRMNLR